MFKRCCLVVALAALVFVPAPSSRAQSAPHPQWVGTWATSPLLAEGPMNLRMLSGVTLREIAHISIGGSQVRVRFTNEFGQDPLTISDAHVALSAGGSAIQPGSDHAITFGGAGTVNIPPGAAIFSDPVALPVAPLSDVAVSFYLPPQVMRAETFHCFADQDNFIATGDNSTAQDLAQSTTIPSWYFFDGIDVAAAPGSYAIVTLGDSITDGALSTHNANLRWPDLLAARLQADPNHKNVGVLNVGIGGNRVLNEIAGPSAISRIDRDVLSQSGVRYVIVLESINDIGRLAHNPHPGGRHHRRASWNGVSSRLPTPRTSTASRPSAPRSRPTAARATPPTRASRCAKLSTTGFAPAAPSTASSTSTRPRRTRRIPRTSTRTYDSGDHLHPKDAGYKAMGAASIYRSLRNKPQKPSAPSIRRLWRMDGIPHIFHSTAPL